MGECIFCGQPAGFFRKQHDECREEHEIGKTTLNRLAAGAFADNVDLAALPAEIDQLCTRAHIRREDKQLSLIAAWDAALRRFSDDGVVTVDEENRLNQYRDAFALSSSVLNTNGAYTRLVQALLLRDLENGQVDGRFDTTGFNQVNFQKGEKVAWIFGGVDYIEEKTRRSYVGGSTGVSFRVMKGVYLRQSAFTGHAVDRTESVVVDNGYAVLTDRNIYFAGARKAWRLPWGKIVSMTPYSDGIGLIKDGANAKPQTLVTKDGVFTYNLANLSYS